MLAGSTGGGGGGGQPSLSRSSDRRVLPPEFRSLDLAFMSSEVTARLCSSCNGSFCLPTTLALVCRNTTPLVFAVGTVALVSLIKFVLLLVWLALLLIVMLGPLFFMLLPLLLLLVDLVLLKLLLVLMELLLMLLGWMNAAVDSFGRLNFPSFSCSSLNNKKCNNNFYLYGKNQKIM